MTEKSIGRFSITPRHTGELVGEKIQIYDKNERVLLVHGIPDQSLVTSGFPLENPKTKEFISSVANVLER